MKESHRQSLEGLKFFSVIAWLILFLFTYFVYTLVVELRTVTAELRTSTDRLEAAVQQDTNSLYIPN